MVWDLTRNLSNGIIEGKDEQGERAWGRGMTRRLRAGKMCQCVRHNRGEEGQEGEERGRREVRGGREKTCMWERREIEG